ncbi:MAG: nucleotidyl transferase AbiEii/AbiGii toxin family protein [Saprospiraceae bacterium]|nr:nucleotidyl transferase AbiEii/AbiGii toxin family protein [Saprospiraceae bacterium]
MLHYETVDSKTLGLLKILQQIPELSNLRLVGGTALALQLGHRKSIDLDLFGDINSDSITISQQLDKIGSVTVLKKSKNINIYLIDNIKVDIVNYHYKWLESSNIVDELVLAGKKDIAAMKLAAITGRGTKKDFIDLFFLLEHYKLDEIFSFYMQKYHDGSLFLVLKSLLYFDDAEQDESPVMLIDTNWELVKQEIKLKVENYLNKN